jgi:hypothetical protein
MRNMRCPAAGTVQSWRGPFSGPARQVSAGLTKATRQRHVMGYKTPRWAPTGTTPTW